MKKIILFVLFLLLPLVANADAVKINGIYYNLIQETMQAEVTSNPDYYSGYVSIPSKVTYKKEEYSVTSIGNRAFIGCFRLSSISIPLSVTKIGDDAFYNCSTMKSVKIPNSVTRIGSGAFYDCTGLTSVSISDVEAWCNIAFGNSESNPLYYAHHLYLGNEEITDLVIPNSVTSIGDYVFKGCSGLTSVTIPNSVTSIGNMAFLNCTGLTSITIPNSVTSIGYYAFNGCTGLTSVTIPNSITSIGGCAFWGCTGLTSIEIPNSVTFIGENAFEDCSGLTSVYISDVEAWCKIAFKGFESNPLYYAHHLYLGNEEITDLVIPNSVTSIGDYAFNGCTGLTSVTIPNSITSIGGYAFWGCTNLPGCIVIPNGVTSIGECAFNNTPIKLPVYPTSLTSIGISAFPESPYINNYVYVSDLKELCNNKVIYLLANIYKRSTCLIDSIDSETGKILLHEIHQIEIPNTVTSIGEKAFYNCKRLTSVTIPNSMTSIGKNAFYDCTGLTSVSISDVEAWCNIAFGNSESNPLYYAHHLYLGNEEITDLVIPNSVTSIGIRAFQGCSGMTSITIPNSVTSIGDYAFNGCDSLQIVRSFIKEPPSVKDLFSKDTYRHATLYIPAGTEKLYTRFEGWKDFLNIVEMSGEDEPDIPGAKKCATPIIKYENGKLLFECETEGAVCSSTITDSDIASYTSNEVSLSVTYKISVYATKEGYNKSDVVTATLCWIDADPKTEGIENSIANVRAKAVLIQSNGNSFEISGTDEGTPITVYDTAGRLVASAKASQGTTSVATSLNTGDIAIIKIGDKTVKVVVK